MPRRRGDGAGSRGLRSSIIARRGEGSKHILHYRRGAPRGERFDVHHLDDLDLATTCKRLADCAGALARWSREHPGHHPLVVWLEPKGQFDAAIADAFLEDLEAELLAAWPREKVITPDVVRGDSSELRAAVRERGWPKLGASRGHVLFALLNDRGYREHYSRGRPNLEGRLLFVQSSQADPFGAVMAMDDPIRDGALIRAAVEANFLVRTRADSGTVEARSNDGRRLQAALESGAQMISTDFPAAARDNAP